MASTPVDFFPHSKREDFVIWLPSKNGQFPAKATWEVLRRRGGMANLIWFQRNVPRWAFICWPVRLCLMFSV